MIRRAMVLAAGRGTRLAPLTDTLPKPLMPVAGRPLLAHILDFLRAGGIDDVVINLHHLGHLIERAIGDGRAFGMRVRYSREDPLLLDTGGGIKHAEPLLAGAPFVVVNGDSLLELPLAEVIDFHRARGGIATMAVRADPDAVRYGLVEVDDTDRVRRISGRPSGGPTDGLRGFMFPGLHVIEPSIFDWMEAGSPFGIVKVTYPRLIEAGEPIYAFGTSARWINIDTPAALERADVTLRNTPFRF